MSTVGKALADTRHPITQLLSKHLQLAAGHDRLKSDRKAKRDERFSVNPRNDIVSEALCDDTIKYLLPTLEQHKGCTIIDIHPGACLWSSKLHDLLKPKRHLLMEPEKGYFEPFIKPLLDKPDSTYRHTKIFGVHPRTYWHNYEKILGDPELAPRETLARDDPKLRQLDPSFLVIGNLARRIKVPTNREQDVALGSFILHQMAYAALANELFHRGGLVRMLWWVPESEKYTMFPTTEVYTRTLNMKMAAALQTSEVVGITNLYDLKSEFYARRKQRPAVLQAYLAERVKRSMSDLVMQCPDTRDFLHDRPDEDTNDIVSPLKTDVTTIDDLETETNAAEERINDVMKLKAMRGHKGSSKLETELMGSLHFPQCAMQAKEMNVRHHLRNEALTAFADMGLLIVKLEVGLVVLRERLEGDSSLDDLRMRILKLDNTLQTFIKQRTRDYYEHFIMMVDQQVACFQDPPIVALDARSYEPLKAEPHEFWPPNDIMLLDLVPKALDLTVPDLATRNEGATLLEILLKHLGQSPSATLPEALEKMAPNAAQDLIPQIPAASDPRRGGRLNPQNIRVRMITPDIIEGLVRAWTEWPFRPATTQLQLAGESESLSDENEAPGFER